jgi:hypothetical protein
MRGNTQTGATVAAITLAERESCDGWLTDNSCSLAAGEERTLR